MVMSLFSSLLSISTVHASLCSNRRSKVSSHYVEQLHNNQNAAIVHPIPSLSTGNALSSVCNTINKPLVASGHQAVS